MIFELIMIACFGISWPVAIFKTIRVKSVKGVSIFFLSLILIGYISGIIYKFFFNYDAVIYLYCLNGVFVFIQIILYFKYRKRSTDS